MSYLGTIADIYFIGLADSSAPLELKGATLSPTFTLLLYQNTVCWLTLSILFLLSAKVFDQKGTRIIDFFGTLALARLPYLVLTLFLIVVKKYNPGILNVDPGKIYQLYASFTMIIVNFIWSLLFVWQIVSYFYALKESSGLNGNKLWISFVVSILIGDVISHLLTTGVLIK
jgi:hypothetical protein